MCEPGWKTEDPSIARLIMNSCLLGQSMLSACLFAIGLSLSTGSAATPFLEGMVVYYRFDGDVKDSMGTGLDGEMSSIAFVSDRYGDSNGAAYFDGLKSVVEVNGTESLNPFPATISLWVKATQNPSAHLALVSKYFASSANGFAVFAKAQSINTWYFGAEGNVFSADDGIIYGPVLDDRWHQVVAVFDDAGGRLYIDAVERGQLGWSGKASPSNSSQNLIFGATKHTSGLLQRFKGALDDVRIYDRGLSSEEVALLFEYEKPPSGRAPAEAATDCEFPAGLVGFWRGEGNAIDMTGGSDGVSKNVEYIPGRVGRAFSFVGADSFVRVPTTEALRSFSKITMECWVWNDAGSPITRLVTLTPDQARLMLIDAGRPQMDVSWGDGVGMSVTAPNPISSNTWHHVAGSFDGARLRVYVDGELVAENLRRRELLLRNIGAASEILVNYPNQGEVGGTIDEVAVYDRALTDQEIRNHFQSASLGRCSFERQKLVWSGNEWHESSDPGVPDRDADGLSDAKELELGTNPSEADSDGDGLSDGFEAGAVRYDFIAGEYSWFEALEFAESKGWHIATITSQAEQSLIEEHFREEIIAAQNTVGVGAGFVWLGGTDAEEDGEWQWVTGEQFQYDNWFELEPNNAALGESYILMYAGNSDDWEWNDFKSSPRDYPGASESFIRGVLLENHFPSDPLNPDTDGDGFDDAVELSRGTNPNDSNVPLSRTGFVSIRIAGTGLEITIKTQADEVYQLQRSRGLIEWSDDGEPFEGTGENVTLIRERLDPLRFWRVLVQ